MRKKDKDPVAKALRHPNVLGAGARKRKTLSAKNTIRAVLKEFARGTLHSGSGAIVKNRKQAIAVALSESKKKYK